MTALGEGANFRVGITVESQRLFIIKHRMLSDNFPALDRLLLVVHLKFLIVVFLNHFILGCWKIEDIIALFDLSQHTINLGELLINFMHLVSVEIVVLPSFGNLSFFSFKLFTVRLSYKLPIFGRGSNST